MRLYSYGKPWTEDEARRAAELRSEGWSWERIGDELGRTPMATEQGVKRFGLAALASSCRFCGKGLGWSQERGGRPRSICDTCRHARAIFDPSSYAPSSCPVCQSVFTPTNARQVYCSRPCRRRKWYLDTLRDPARKERLLARSRRNNAAAYRRGMAYRRAKGVS